MEVSFFISFYKYVYIYIFWGEKKNGISVCRMGYIFRKRGWGGGWGWGECVYRVYDMVWSCDLSVYLLINEVYVNKRIS